MAKARNKGCALAVSFLQLRKNTAELFFQGVCNCHERKSLIITLDLEFSQWNTVFGDNRSPQLSLTA